MPDFSIDMTNGASFEASVREIARYLYRNASTTGSIKIDGRERDEIIDTGTEVIVVEATLLRKLDKAQYDLTKSIELVKKLRKTDAYSDYNFRIILVTGEEPTADQNSYVRSTKAGCPKEIISFNTLFSRLFDAKLYLRLRADHAFGSVRDPADENNFRVPASSYIPTSLSDSSGGNESDASRLADSIISGGRYVIYGDYGSGKSMTLRDIYYKVRDKFVAGKTLLCPVYINLRDHIAQTRPDEVLYRHSDQIGLQDAHRLISAWRAGYVTLFLDGFDELTPPQFASSAFNLREARRFAVEIVKNFIEQTPSSAPIFICGRESYFDTRVEARVALGYAKSAREFDLAGFSDLDIQKFLNSQNSSFPEWLPSRPLLLGYLANSGLLEDNDEISGLSPATGWDWLLDRVCEREVRQIWGVGFEAHELRRFIERLATQTRKSFDDKAIENSGLRSVFHSVFGKDAGEPANLLTMRLPGLGSVPGRLGAREFIDDDFFEAAASGDLRRFIESPFTAIGPLAGVRRSTAEFGREMATIGLDENATKVSLALQQACNDGKYSLTAGDLISVLNDNKWDYQGPRIEISDANFDRITLDGEVNFSNITLKSCAITSLEINVDSKNNMDENSIALSGCLIGQLEGAFSAGDVPSNMLTGGTVVEKYAAYTATNDAVMQSGLPDSVKVLITILRKLFMQRGTGRRYNALRRGLPPNTTKYVDPIVAQIKTLNFAQDVYLNRHPVLIPNRSRSKDALSIINGPNTSASPLIDFARKL